MTDMFETYEPREEDLGKEPPLMALRRMAYRRACVERELAEVVASARRSGISWAKIGEQIGTSGEAARQRYGNKVA